MLDLKFVRDNTEKVAQALKNRHAKVDLEEFKKLTRNGVPCSRKWKRTRASGIR